MATPRLNHTLQELIRQLRRLRRQFTKAFVNWVLRGLFLIGRSPLSSSGFVLPTVVLLLLILSLTVGAISYRSFTRTSDAISDRQQRVIYNTATPTIDRAKAKLEFLFGGSNGGDPRKPGGIPSEDQLLNMMYNDGRGDVEPIITLTKGGKNDDYTFPDEIRVDLDDDGNWDNAWRYPVDRDGDGTNDAWNIYSIIFKTPQANSPNYSRIRLSTDPKNPATPIGIDDTGMELRADQLMIRNAPLSNSASTSSACTAGLSSEGSPAFSGWFEDEGTPGQVRKNFQVDALVVPFNENGEFTAGSPVSSLEFQQDRIALTGNKWGAWFRNDLEIFPGPKFNWNGAMHTRGNFFVGDSNDSFKSFLISDPASCVYTKDASRITMAHFEEDQENNIPAFQGQFLNASVKRNNFQGASTINLYDPANPLANDKKMTSSTDTVTASSNATNYSLDPVMLLTEEVSQSRGWAKNQGNNKFVSTTRDPKWVDSEFEYGKPNGRIRNKTEEIPYVDDQYRADNRWGPKARVKGGLFEIPDEPKSANNPGGYDIGHPITGSKLSDQGLNDEELIKVSAPEFPSKSDLAENVGLDGYWERRADYQGLKLIVGQRLELGNNMGWGGVDGTGVPVLASATGVSGRLAASKAEPLRPWNNCRGATGNINANDNRCNEARQRRMLRDNLAAVQSMAVYHFASGRAGMPLACMASTVHPGTPESLARAATFANWNPAGYKNLKEKYPLAISNFFLGVGTNGWEFEPPDKSDFVSLDTPVMKALQNLAYYAGDPNGGAPSFTPVNDDKTVHPYPSMAMWGDFALLRRVLPLLQANGYDQLSPADQATLHTAACTVGMLAYNIDYLNQLYGPGLPYGDLKENGSDVDVIKTDTTLFTDLKSLAGAIQDIRNDGTPPINIDVHTPDNYIYGLKQDLNLNNAGNRRLIALAEMIATKEQVRRDRLWGFIGATGGGVVDVDKDKNYISPSCEAFKNYKEGSNTPLEPLVELCSDYPKYPIMEALFTTRSAALTEASGGGQYLRDQEDIDSKYNTYINSVNASYVYKPLTDTEIAQVALKPRSITDWKLPYEANTGSVDKDFSAIEPNNPNHPNLLLLKQCVAGDDICIEKDQTFKSSLMRIGFKDAALFNGREMMTVRTMDLDLDMLRQKQVGGSYWLPSEERAGVIYAFREDGVREGAIVRPPSGDWTKCGTTQAIENEPACRMNTTPDAYSSTDPPLAPNGISPKPVDYYADPDRRPFAFRLKNGKTIERPNKSITGMTIVSDNALYIQGDFNFHRSGGAEVQEFNELRTDDGNGNIANFYTRGDSGLNGKFARPKTDGWRPAEILADAITLLPVNFCDGSILDTFGSTVGNTTVNYACSGSGNRTSFQNQNTPSSKVNKPNNPKPPAFLADGWLRENPFRENKSPIRVSRDGNPILVAGSYANLTTYDNVQEYGAANSEKYLAFADAKNQKIGSPVRTDINAVIVSGLVPSRTGQSYGGMHNFPRFITTWNKLYIQGSLLQLNFSNAATAPFDQEAWEVGQTPTVNTELIHYYGAPDRIWGYDVGLQYAAPGPLSSRFAAVEDGRSEFYSEPALDDPYVVKLCEAMQKTKLVKNLLCE